METDKIHLLLHGITKQIKIKLIRLKSPSNLIPNNEKQLLIKFGIWKEPKIKLEKLNACANTPIISKTYGKIPLLSCPEPNCGIKSAQLYKLKKHVEIHSKERNYQCKICGTAFRQKGGVVNHLILSHKVKISKDVYCKYFEILNQESTPLLQKINELKKVHERPFKCNICNCSYSARTSLNSHLRTHFEEKKFACTYEGCSYKFFYRGNLLKHCKVHSTERPFKCEFKSCGESFRLRQQLRKHAVLKHCSNWGKTIFKCTDCEYVTIASNRLKEHKRTHTGEKPLKCPLCEFSAATKSSLRGHIFSHTGEKPHKCFECNRHFTRSHTLKRHQLTHKSTKANKCEFCNFETSRKDVLKIHIIRKHDTINRQRLQCLFCEKTYFSKSVLGHHLRVHTGERPYVCSMCCKSFSSPNSIRRLKDSNLRKYVCHDCIKKEKAKGYDFDKLKFNVKKRLMDQRPQNPVGIDAVSLLKDSQIVDEPSFVCNMEMHKNYFRVNQNITLHSIGFPLEKDSLYDVSLKIRNHTGTHTLAKVIRKVYAKQKEVFHVRFEEPFVLKSNSNSYADAFMWYQILYVIQGADTQSANVVPGPNEWFEQILQVPANNAEIKFQHFSNQVAQMCLSTRLPFVTG